MTDVSATLAERGGRYGKFADHAAIAQGLQQTLHAAPNWSKLDPDMRQALCVITDKMARILNGDPYYDDNWHDIQGYAQLVEARIKEMQQSHVEPVNMNPMPAESTPPVHFYTGENPLAEGGTTDIFSQSEYSKYQDRDYPDTERSLA